MTHRIRTSGREFLLLSDTTAPEGWADHPHFDADDARRFLRQLAADQLAMMQVRQWITEAANTGGSVPASDLDVLNAGARMLETGRLRVATRAHRPGVIAGGAAARRQAPPPERRSSGDFATPSMLTGRPRDVVAPAPPPASQTPTHWIEIELVGEDDKPIPNEAYTVKLPDGREVSGKLDANGFARIDGLDQGGTCEVCFGDLDGAAWSKLGTFAARQDVAAAAS